MKIDANKFKGMTFDEFVYFWKENGISLVIRKHVFKSQNNRIGFGFEFSEDFGNRNTLFWSMKCGRSEKQAKSLALKVFDKIPELLGLMEASSELKENYLK